VRVDLARDGTLTITAETPTEGFALDAWEARRKGRGNRPALVIVSEPAPHTGGLLLGHTYTVPVSGQGVTLDSYLRRSAATDSNGMCG
jgi:hypothetical protein